MDFVRYVYSTYALTYVFYYKYLAKLMIITNLYGIIYIILCLVILYIHAFNHIILVCRFIPICLYIPTFASIICNKIINFSCFIKIQVSILLLTTISNKCFKIFNLIKKIFLGISILEIIYLLQRHVIYLKWLF